MDNIKGQSELCALTELGFVLKYNLYSIEAGIRMYQKGELTAVEVGTYGLEEKVMHGRKLLYLSRAAVQQLFGARVSSYADRKLWQKMGPICTKAENVPLLKLKNAIDFFNKSLAKRSAGGDSGHDFMRAKIEACVTALEECYERRDLADTSARLGGLSLTGASK
jgi:hypothetical protein